MSAHQFVSSKNYVSHGAAARVSKLKGKETKSLFRVPTKDKQSGKTGLALFVESIDWIHFVVLIVFPIVAAVGCATLPEISTKTIAWAVVYYVLTGWGITAGYHRLWSHRSYKAALPLEVFLALVGAGAFEGSIKWWSTGHRAHHRYTDTEKDPYNSLRGFFYAHMGWMLLKQDWTRIGRVDISDLRDNQLVNLQHKYYLLIAPFMAFVFPSIVAGLGWGDWLGGLFVAGFARLIVVHHSTFCVNSLAHYTGDAPFDDVLTPRDSVITALVTLGEGYHNFHHEFPTDYRNAIRWYQYDPTKWFIRLMSYCGLAYDLNKFDESTVQKGRIMMEQKALDKRREELDWGTPPEELPVWDEARIRKEKDAGRKVVTIFGLVHDVTEFLPKHPGGERILQRYNGLDASEAFDGGVYNHTNAARNLMSGLRIARAKGGQFDCTSTSSDKKHD